MATTRLIPLHIGEGRTFSTAIEDIIDYVENPEKLILEGSYMDMSVIPVPLTQNLL